MDACFCKRFVCEYSNKTLTNLEHITKVKKDEFMIRLLHLFASLTAAVYSK